MRARYYSPDMKRFINADIVAGQITNAVTLNRYAFANANPVMFVDPLGLWSIKETINKLWNNAVGFVEENVIEPIKENVITPIVDTAEMVVSDLTTMIPELWEESLNADGTRSLYDNDRFEDKNGAFHEQAIVYDPIGTGIDVSDGSFDLGGSIYLYTGGLEYENLDLSIFDLGKLTAGISISPINFKAEVGASIYSPSATFKVGENTNLTIDLNLGIVFGTEFGESFGLDLGIVGISVSPA